MIAIDTAPPMASGRAGLVPPGPPSTDLEALGGINFADVLTTLAAAAAHGPEANLEGLVKKALARPAAGGPAPSVVLGIAPVDTSTLLGVASGAARTAKSSDPIAGVPSADAEPVPLVSTDLSDVMVVASLMANIPAVLPQAQSATIVPDAQSQAHDQLEARRQQGGPLTELASVLVVPASAGDVPGGLEASPDPQHSPGTAGAASQPVAVTTGLNLTASIGMDAVKTDVPAPDVSGSVSAEELVAAMQGTASVPAIGHPTAAAPPNRYSSGAVPAPRLGAVPAGKGTASDSAAISARASGDASSLASLVAAANDPSRQDDRGDGERPSTAAGEPAVDARHEIPPVALPGPLPLPTVTANAIGEGLATATLRPSDAADVGPQIVRAIKLQWNGGIGEARIRLQPEYLGELTIAIRVERGAVTASLESDTAAVRQWLQGHESLLRQGLTDQGLYLDRLLVAEESLPAEWDRHEQRHQHEDEDAPKQKSSRRQPDGQTFNVIV